MQRSFTGINIQFPISRLILSGEKSVETRTYPIPVNYVGKELLIIETPGPARKFRSRIVGSVVFAKCYRYRNKDEFQRDVSRHHVSRDSPWKWTPAKPKWAWEIEKVRVFKETIPAPKKLGIVYTKEIFVDVKAIS